MELVASNICNEGVCSSGLAQKLTECLQGKWSFVENTKTSLYMSSFLIAAIKLAAGYDRGENTFILAL